MRDKNTFSINDKILAAALIILIPFMIWKTRYGYGGGDESFYLTLADRFAKGDAPLSEEWNLAQLSGLLLMPFYKLISFFSDTTDGIVLKFRVLYVIIQTLCAVILYLNLRKHQGGALFAALSFLIFTPYDLMALSYNTMGVMLTLLSFSFFLKAVEGEKNKTFSLVLCGILYGGSVLCNPYLIILYFLFAVICIAVKIVNVRKERKKEVEGETKEQGIEEIYEEGKVIRVRRGKEEVPESVLSIKSLLKITIGAFVPLLYLLIILVSRGSFHNFFANIKMMLNDPEHGFESMYTKCYTFVYVYLLTYLLPIIVFAVSAILLFFRNIRKKFGFIIIAVNAAVCIFSIAGYVLNAQTAYNLLFFPVILVGVVAFLASEKKNMPVFLIFVGFGFMFTFCASISSNQGINAVCQGMPIMLVGAAICAYEYMQEDKENAAVQKAVYITGFITASVLILSQIYVKAVHAFWEPGVFECNKVITEGPLAGLYTSEENYAKVKEYVDDMTIVKRITDPSDEILVVTVCPWNYLMLGGEYGTYSSWVSSAYSKSDPNDVLLERLQSYYDLHPDKIPRIIYIARNDGWDFSGFDGVSHTDMPWGKSYGIIGMTNGWTLILEENL